MTHLIKPLKLRRGVATPHDERNLELLLRCHRRRKHTVHIHITLAKALTVVRDVNHRSITVLNATEYLDDRVQQVVGVEDGVIVGVDKLTPIGLSHLHRSAYWRKVLELLGILLVVCRAVACACMEHHEELIALRCLDLLA